MLSDLTPAQLMLAKYMSELSEEAYYAGWMDGLEYALWEAVQNTRGDYGRLVFTPEHRERLGELSRNCKGWIVFEDEGEESWVSTPEWERRYSAWRTNRCRHD